MNDVTIQVNPIAAAVISVGQTSIAISVPQVAGPSISVAQQAISVSVEQIAAPQITVSSLGEKGLKGDAGTVETYIYPAGENLSSGRAVIKQAGKLYYYNPNDLTQAGKNIGITITSGLVNQNVSVRYSGSITDSAFAFDSDMPLFVGASGQIFSSVQNVSTIVQAGVSLSTNTLIINFQSPILKT